MRPSGIERRLGALLLSVILACAMLPIAPAYAASTYVGGVVDPLLHVLNDHTPIGVRFSAETTPTGLLPSTRYYVKFRFTVGSSPSTTTNRGFTWNPGSGRWVQEHEPWTEFPTVWTDSEGRILNKNGDVAPEWVFAKFGDERLSGTYHMMVSLSATGAATTYNPLDPPEVTVLDASTAGGWVHNGIDMATLGAAVDATRAAVRGPDSTGDGDTDPSLLHALNQTEANAIDDDADGAIDEADEDRGPAGTAGDFYLGVPAETTVTVSTKRKLRFDDFLTAPADCDLAVGADDMTPPGQVQGLSASGAPHLVHLAWDAASDDGGSGLAAYGVYRWETPDPTSVQMFTPPASLIATLSPDVTEYADTDVVPGTGYSYTVRAFDADTNVGPRSNVVAAIPWYANELYRDWGTDRYATALDISRKTFVDGSVDTVVIATGADFPDALAASGLAGAYGSPLLLVGSAVTPALIDELERLGTSTVVLVGGEKAISADVAGTLDDDYVVKRVAGADRYETAAEIAREIERLGGVSDTAYFVRGDDFADALAVAPFAYAQSTPVLLVLPTGVPEATRLAIADLGTETGIIAGGPVAVGAGAARILETLLGSEPERLDGDDRYETAVAVVRYHIDAEQATYHYVGVATGRVFADALGGGAAAGANGGALLLTQPDSLPEPTRIALNANAPMIEQLHVFGGDAAVTAGVYDAIDAILQ